MPPRANKAAARPKSAGAAVDDAPPPEKPKRVVTFERTTMPDDLFAAAIARFAVDERMHIDNFPPPVHGYNPAGWVKRVLGSPIKQALRTVVCEAAASTMGPGDVASRLVEQLFALGLTEHRTRPTDDEDATTMDGRAMMAIAITYFLMDHCKSAGMLREHMHKLDREEQRALWDALDPNEKKWAGKPGLPEMETALWDMYSTAPGDVSESIIGAVACAVHAKLGEKSVGDLVDELLTAVYSMAEWSKTMREEAPAVDEATMLDALVTAPLRARQTPKVEAVEMAVCVPAVPTLGPEQPQDTAPPPPLPLAASWTPTAASVQEAIVVGGGSRTAMVVDLDEDLFEAKLREACMQSATRRRQII